jgi:heme A synthase
MAFVLHLKFLEAVMQFLFTMAIISALATLVVLIMGVMTMGRDSEENKKRKNKLMRWRVGLQFLTLILLLLTAATYS